MIVVIFLLILVILLAQFAIICAKRELTETETSPLPPGSSSSSAQAVKVCSINDCNKNKSIVVKVKFC
ncbi:hypothetical protein RB195_004293 [Necator americanus]|uniref:Secreted protein n=1 Tax=Necator americanus TaxID=51031 RepID=A0ABR1BH98_NECAM